MLHRMYLVAGREDIPFEEVMARWQGVHRDRYLEIPGLLGYVQNRPVAAPSPAQPYAACWETWFLDRPAEKAAFQSAYYREQVVPDEATFADRSRYWSAPVTADGWPQAAPYRLLAFGGDPAAVPEAQVLPLVGSPPLRGPRHVLSLWAEDLESVREAAGAAGGLVLVTAPTILALPV
jgi:hypothetical protein